MDIISVHYIDIRRLFHSRLSNIGKGFDEDAFNDAFIKCALRFGEKEISYEDAVKYYWVAFLNTIRTADGNKLQYDLDAEIDEEIIDEPYDEEIDEMFDHICDGIEKEFGKEHLLAFKMVVCDGWSMNELIENKYVTPEFKNTYNKIRKFAKKNYSDKWKKYLDK